MNVCGFPPHTGVPAYSHLCNWRLCVHFPLVNACCLSSEQHSTRRVQGHQPCHRSDIHASMRLWIHHRLQTEQICVTSHQRLLNLDYLSPAGHLFDLSTLTKVGGYTVYDHHDQRKMFRINICGNLPDSGCGPNAGACITPVLVL